MIALIDYGAGNLTSVRKALSHLQAEFVTPAAPAELTAVRAMIVPGVGHFDATRAIDPEWRDAIRSAVGRGARLFGICLGMQWLFEGSDEAPDVPGLAVFSGRCHKLAGDGVPRDNAGQSQPRGPDAPVSAGSRAAATPLKIPHVGWNSLVQPKPTTLMAGVPEGAQVYFTHSYVAPPTPAAAATTTYGITFTAAVERGLVSGVQFHPEKSGDVGLQILRNWLTELP